MYFANPPMEPDLDFYKDTMKMLIKYNDRYGMGFENLNQFTHCTRNIGNFGV